jgi:hypothetical protein
MTFKERQQLRRSQEFIKPIGREAPEPIAVTLDERQALRRAELEGQRLADERAAERERARRAALPQRPVNAFQLLLDQDTKRYREDSPAGKKRRADLIARAASREREIDAELEAKAKADALTNNPDVQKAIADADEALRDAMPQDRGQRAELLAIAKEGEVSMYWQRSAGLYARIRERESEKLAELFSRSTTEQLNHAEQAAIVKAAQAGFDAAIEQSDLGADESRP